MCAEKTTTVKDVIQTIRDRDIEFVDLRFTDFRGKEQHISVPSHIADEDFFKEGKMFDGSSLAGWKDISSSDMILRPDVSTVKLDPFYEHPTLFITCDIVDPATMHGYSRDPRTVGKRAERYLIETGIGDTAMFGPEPEFFLFDNVRFAVGMDHVFFQVDSKEAAWNSETIYPEGNMGHRPTVKGGYFPVPPVDSSQDIRSEMCQVLKQLGMFVETHHHEVATGNQNEIGTGCDTLVRKADQVLLLKYVVANVAAAYGKTATFMPKPLVGDNGSGMHCHQSISKDGKNIFAGDVYAGLSETALHYVGGIIKHARALNAFTNSSTNSYKRLVPGFEAPVMLAYAARNRSAAIRIPHVPEEKGRRIEVRFPDACGNPYLAFAAMMMAGLDGIKNKIHPGEPMDANLYNLHPDEAKKVPRVCGNLIEAVNALREDHQFLLEGGVFTEDLIQGWIELKNEEVYRLLATTHPIEFDLYYSL
ncbi:MAG: type I glutamate--ammonia ligase [Coxiellaceae bacterium]|nr:type I glutamate--ammonia ligase [Coxiellaceae bacterium]